MDGSVEFLYSRASIRTHKLLNIWYIEKIYLVYLVNLRKTLSMLCQPDKSQFFKSTLQFCKYFWDLIDNIVLNICANLKYNRYFEIYFIIM